MKKPRQRKPLPHGRNHIACYLHGVIAGCSDLGFTGEESEPQKMMFLVQDGSSSEGASLALNTRQSSLSIILVLKFESGVFTQSFKKVSLYTFFLNIETEAEFYQITFLA